MKLKLIAVSALLSITSLSFAGHVKMPPAQDLHERLRDFKHFVEKTNIVNELAGKELQVLSVAVAVDASLYFYNKYLEKGGMQPQKARVMQMQMRPFLFKALLQYSPEALRELKEKGIYKPIEANL